MLGIIHDVLHEPLEYGAEEGNDRRALTGNVLLPLAIVAPLLKALVPCFVLPMCTPSRSGYPTGRSMQRDQSLSSRRVSDGVLLLGQGHDMEP